MSQCDLTYQIINIVDSLEKTDLPGFIASSSPRNAHRMRVGDFFFALITITSAAPPSDNKTREMLAGMPAAYFQARGSVTLAMQTAAEQINQQLLEYNRRSVTGSTPVHGSLNIGVIRQNSLYILHSGETSTYIFSDPGVEKICSLATGDRSPGTSPKLDYSFKQLKINKGDFVLFCACPPRRWEVDGLTQSNIKTHHQLRRRLVNPTDNNLTAAVLQVVSGKGVVLPQIKFSTGAPSFENKAGEMPGLPRVGRTLPPVVKVPPVSRGKDAPTDSGSPLSYLRRMERGVIRRDQGAKTNKEAAVPTGLQSTAGMAADTKGSQPEGWQAATDPSKVQNLVDQHTVGDKTGFLEKLKNRTYALVKNPLTSLEKLTASYKTRRVEESKPVISPEIKKKMSTVWFKGRSTAEKLEVGSRDVTRRLLPTREEFGGSLSPFTMLFIAVAIPLVIVAVASTVYIRSGHDELFESYSEQAREYAEEAQNSTDPVIQRNSWTQALYYVDKAENYFVSQELEDIRMQAQSALDSMEGVARLSLKSATGQNFPGNLNITRMAASRTDLYLLDGNKGKVLRFFLTGQGYEYDNSFSCSPGPMGVIVIKPLVDLAILPVNNILKAAVMAVDSSGNLIFCVPGENPMATSLTPPDANWGEINAMDFQDDTLYLMDPPNNAVWYISGMNLNFSDPPRLYFDTTVPNMAEAVDFSINSDALYILHDGGKMTLCNSGSATGWETKCNDPNPYGDNRDGRGSQMLTFPEANFSQLVTTRMPDSSIYILDVRQPAVYHFSLRLNLQRLLMPLADSQTVMPNAPVTSFTVSQNRLVFIAYGDEVFYAPLP